MSNEFSTTTQRIGPLPAGRYKVLGSTDGAEGKKFVTLKGEPERKLKLRLK